MEEQVDDMLSVLDAAGSRSAAFFGFSQAGPIALLFAATHPERTRALVLYGTRSEEHTSELQSLRHLVCRLLLEKKKIERERGTGLCPPWTAPHRADRQPFR